LDVKYATPLPFGRFMLLERLHLGHTAEVWRALLPASANRAPVEVALKRLLPHVANDEDLGELLLREVEVLERLDHPNIARFVDHGRNEGTPFVCTELIEGVTLRRVLLASSGRRMAWPLVATLVADVASGLGAAHAQGFVHRDISPTNVLVDQAGTTHIIDFGIARILGRVSLTQAGQWRGKWAYAAPEQVDGREVGVLADVFALGCVLVECLDGSPPFLAQDREKTLDRVREAHFAGLKSQGIPLEIASLAARMLQREPADRPTANEVAKLALSLAAEASEPGARRMLAQLCENTPRGSGDELDDDAAELRGEDVTDPGGVDVTQVRTPS